MSLATVIKEREKSKSTSQRTPQYYNKEKNRFIADIVNHKSVIVREFACSNEHVPSQMIQQRLEKETEREVIRAILMNPNLPQKTLIEFAVKDSRAKMFDDDQELTEYVESLNLKK